MQNGWMTGVTLALLVAAPVAIQAQTATEKAGMKAEQPTDKTKGTPTTGHSSVHSAQGRGSAAGFPPLPRAVWLANRVSIPVSPVLM